MNKINNVNFLVRFGHKLDTIHNQLRYKKDDFIKPIVNRLPKKITPNQITFFRLIIVLIWLPFVFLKPSIYQILIFFTVYFFDLLDGALARLKDKCTQAGKYFDPLADYFNHLTTYLLILKLTNYGLKTLNFFMIWESCMIIVIFVNWMVKSDKLTHIRVAFQFTAKIALWIVLIWEVVRVIK